MVTLSSLKETASIGFMSAQRDRMLMVMGKCDDEVSGKTPLEVRPIGYLRRDKACEKENVAVCLYNDVDGDQEPLYYDYLAKSIITCAEGEIKMTGCY
ncbi:unnamed protein product [Microthlaspi erraticum]|uniref:Uncharacterized protein n=1 Tax=Microthlaspi erraticum TaxID=1685480 RepID=A0A6D2HKN9_9BRAS|nr:unnamed protein product [Microthlaspi erraticum]CAA7044686.1 unnamed protein product [Microthlaspi erraticum]